MHQDWNSGGTAGFYISWGLALLGVEQEGSGGSEGGKRETGREESKEECSMGRAGDRELQHVQMALGLRSPARACFDIPQKGSGGGQGEGSDKSSCCEPLVGCLSQGLRGLWESLCRK